MRPFISSQTEQKIKDALSHVARNPYLIAPIAQMVAVKLAQLWGTSGATQEDVERIQAQIAKVLGFVAFGEAFTGITNRLVASVDQNNQLDVNAAQTIGTLFFAGLSVLLDVIMFSPGVKMEKYGSWLIAASLMIASLLKEYAFGNTAAHRDENLTLPGFVRFAKSRLGGLMLFGLPLVAIHFTSLNVTSKNREAIITDVLWLSAILLNAVPAVIAGLQDMTVRVANIMRFILLSGASSVVCIAMNLAGNNDARLNSMMPNLASLFAILSISSSYGLHDANQIAHTGSNNTIAQHATAATEAFFKMIYFFAAVARLMGPQLIVAASVLTATSAAGKEFSRNAGEALTFVAMMQNLWSATVAYRRTHEGFVPEMALIMLQAMLFGIAMSNRAKEVAGRYDITPYLFMAAALVHYITQRVVGNYASRANYSTPQNEEAGLLNHNVSANVPAPDNFSQSRVRALLQNAWDLVVVRNPFGQDETAVVGRVMSR